MKRFKIYWFFRKLYDRYLSEKDESLIPKGLYCHGQTIQDPNDSKRRLCPDRCPYWSVNPYANKQDFGYCSFCAVSDWGNDGFGLLWDSCKCCGINEGLEEFENE